MSKPNIGVIIGSTREHRFGEKPAKWIARLAEARGDLNVELIDLRDYPMPFFDEVASSHWAPSKNEVAKKWQAKIASLDGYIVTAAEYNRGPTAVLKNALDYAYDEWNNKPVAFVGYGGVGGARAVEQLRLISIELQMAPIRNAVHIAWTDMSALKDGKATFEQLPHLGQGAKDLLDQLKWWTDALKAARDKDKTKG